MKVSRMHLSYIVLIFVSIPEIYGIFVKENWLDGLRTNQRNYGVAVSDVNNDGNPDFIVAGYSGANFVFTYNKTLGTVTNIAQEGTPYANLRDIPGNAIGTYLFLHFYVFIFTFFRTIIL